MTMLALSSFDAAATAHSTVPIRGACASMHTSIDDMMRYCTMQCNATVTISLSKHRPPISG
ncbi:hypothetical protein TRIATDRAFT_301434 [Trichoderma atroviride IMI 206040]|uniref:Uncharacterized protein n=1 Tax=Hypocrea atroviridis (strain ATCC 20476 / IMI 206040) TaxID=452589 RepID=G9P6H7_HYPAI|nr:uncharacterized protein TRIATDRAFT_301434 [Trichoderma atroviride IMI 206040]EHK40620.1 hypothetical protein TRIATDRAFT_301434 [Trichoderma atroviride IMI 206040]